MRELKTFINKKHIKKNYFNMEKRKNWHVCNFFFFSISFRFFFFYLLLTGETFRVLL
jgi:hypothetical protein